MRKGIGWFIRLFLALAMVFLFTGAKTADVIWVDIEGVNMAVDALNGIDAIYTEEANAADDVVYSCAAYVKKYYALFYGVTVYNLMDEGPPMVQEKGAVLEEVEKPQEGDIIFYPVSLNKNNHSSIVKKVDGDEITLIEQNYKTGTKAGIERKILLSDKDFQIWRLSGDYVFNKNIKIPQPTDKMDKETDKYSETEENNNKVSPKDETIPVFKEEETSLPTETEEEEKPPKVPVIEKEFYDLSRNHWAYDSIMLCVNQGIFTGYEDGGFQPDKTITRAEFSVLLAKAKGIAPSGAEKSEFTDISPGDWYFQSVVYASQFLTGVMQMDGTQVFYPQKPAQREDIAVAIVKLMELDGISPDMSVLNQFHDENVITEYGKYYIAIALEAGFISGFDDGTFRPDDGITRAQAAVILSKII